MILILCKLFIETKIPFLRGRGRKLALTLFLDEAEWVIDFGLCLHKEGRLCLHFRPRRRLLIFPLRYSRGHLRGPWASDVIDFATAVLRGRNDYP